MADWPSADKVDTPPRKPTYGRAWPAQVGGSKSIASPAATQRPRPILLDGSSGFQYRFQALGL